MEKPKNRQAAQPALQAASRHIFTSHQSEPGLTDGLRSLFCRPTGHLEVFLGISAHFLPFHFASIHNCELSMLKREIMAFERSFMIHHVSQHISAVALPQALVPSFGKSVTLTLPPVLWVALQGRSEAERVDRTGYTLPLESEGAVSASSVYSVPRSRRLTLNRPVNPNTQNVSRPTRLLFLFACMCTQCPQNVTGGAEVVTRTTLDTLIEREVEA